MASLSSMYEQHQGKVSDKWSLYLRVYEELFGSKRTSITNMLEIGVQNGGSLEIWAQYLPNAKHLVGCDIDPQCGTLFFDDPRVSVIVGDANSAGSIQSVRAISPNYDVIIDDGSHVPRDVIAAFINYFPMLTPGGIYVVEDVHCDYLDTHAGGILNPLTSTNFFHCLVHLMNQAHWNPELAPETFASGFIPREQFPPFLKQRFIDSIAFYDSMIIIRRADAEGSGALGTRIIAGKIVEVCGDPVVMRDLSV